MGIDPGIARMGYGIVDVHQNGLVTVDYGCIETEARLPVAERLQIIFRELQRLMTAWSPQVMAVEELFFNRNTTTAFIVGQARGVALLAAAEAGLSTAEYTPMQVKLAVVGYGKADKTQVQEMTRILLNLRQVPKPDDTADALAVAITHAHSADMRRLSDEVLPQSKATGHSTRSRSTYRRGGRS